MLTRRVLVPPAVVCALLTGMAAPALAAPSTRLHLDVENGESGAAGSLVRDDSGQGSNGVVQVAHGGTLRVVAGVGGSRALRFPARCTAEPCANAMVRIPDAPALDPGTAAFEWGASVSLTSAETAKGSNVLQKGRYDDPGGQWKLQVDGAAGLPSCIVSGRRADGSLQRTKVTSSVSIASGGWRKVTCRRTASTLSVVVDGVTRSVPTSPVRVESAAPVTVGAKAVAPWDNDQFHGAVDELFMRLL